MIGVSTFVTASNRARRGHAVGEHVVFGGKPLGMSTRGAAAASYY